MVDYPECEKLRAVSSESQIIGEFLEWLLSGEADSTGFHRPIFPAAYEIVVEEWDSSKGKYVELSKDKWRVSDQRMHTIGDSTEDLLVRFFNIDMTKVEREREAMLKKLKENAEG